MVLLPEKHRSFVNTKKMGPRSHDELFLEFISLYHEIIHFSVIRESYDRDQTFEQEAIRSFLLEYSVNIL